MLSTRLAGTGMVGMRLNPPGQYADDRSLRAWQRLWQHQVPFFDVAGWVLGLAGLAPGMGVLDAGCGNGAYLRTYQDQVARPWAGVVADVRQEVQAVIDQEGPSRCPGTLPGFPSNRGGFLILDFRSYAAAASQAARTARICLGVG